MCGVVDLLGWAGEKVTRRREIVRKPRPRTPIRQDKLRYAGLRQVANDTLQIVFLLISAMTLAFSVLVVTTRKICTPRCSWWRRLAWQHLRHAGGRLFAAVRWQFTLGPLQS
jgi:hypothetical protein